MRRPDVSRLLGFLFAVVVLLGWGVFFWVVYHG